MFAIDAAVPIIIVQVRFRIVLGRFQFHDVAVRRFSDIIGDVLGMAAGRIIDDQRLAIAFGRSLGRRIGLFDVLDEASAPFVLPQAASPRTMRLLRASIKIFFIISCLPPDYFK